VLRVIGEPLLRPPNDLHSLRHRLERASIDPALNRAVSALSASIDLGSLLSMSLEPVAADLTPRLGEVAALAVVRGMRYEIAAFAASMNLVALIPRENVDAQAALRASRRPGAHAARVVTEFLNRLLYDPSVPLTVSETFAAVRRGNAALLGILYALVSGKRVAHGLAIELAQVYGGGMHGYARLLASIPAAGVSDEIVPAAERYNMPALEQAHAEFWRRLAAGEHSFGPPDDDDG
jgi:hypothetical protein